MGNNFSNNNLEKIENANKTLLVLVGFSCNNNCAVCSVKPKGKNYPDRSTEEIKNDIDKGRKDGFRSIEFTGGEPTIRKDIVELVSFAKDKNYKKISFSTNGRIFSYPKFCQEIIQVGLNKITFSLLGPNAAIHDAVTRTPGSFEQIISGIKNAQNYPIHINVSSVISRLNFRNLKKLGQYVNSLKVKHWYILDLIPDGNAKINYSSLVIKLEDLYKELNSILDIADKFEEFGFFDFPFCLFNPKLKNTSNSCFINTQSRIETSQQVGYDPQRFSKDKEKGYKDIYKINVEICKKCKFYKECGGIWEPYLDLYGSEKLIYLAKKNSCIYV